MYTIKRMLSYLKDYRFIIGLIVVGLAVSVIYYLWKKNRQANDKLRKLTKQITHGLVMPTSDQASIKAEKVTGLSADSDSVTVSIDPPHGRTSSPSPSPNHNTSLSHNHPHDYDQEQGQGQGQIPQAPEYDEDTVASDLEKHEINAGSKSTMGRMVGRVTTDINNMFRQIDDLKGSQDLNFFFHKPSPSEEKGKPEEIVFEELDENGETKDLAPPVTAPPVTASPVTAPPVTASPVTAPPVTAPPVTAPPVTANKQMITSNKPMNSEDVPPPLDTRIVDTNEETSNEEASNGESSNEETSNEETSNEETSNEETSNEETSNEEASNVEASKEVTSKPKISLKPKPKINLKTK